MAKTNAPSFELPDWVNWLAQDSSGSWWGYSVEPLRNDTGWYENEIGQCTLLGHSLPEHWEHSLCPARKK